MFKDRQDAGRQLAQKLEKYSGEDIVVLAIPRGGVVTGAEAAAALKAPLDIIAIRKIGHPHDPEYSVGAVDENGTSLLSEEDTELLDKKILQAETLTEQKEAKRRSTVYRAGQAPLSLTGKTVIIVDDGIATGFTMRLAVRHAKAQNPAKIIVATPVAPFDSIDSVRSEAVDELFVLEPPQDFEGAIGAHYLNFDQVEDDEVIKLLQVHQVRTT